jgi:Peptidase family S41/PDZ domain
MGRKAGVSLKALGFAALLLIGGGECARAALSTEQRQADFAELVSIVERSYGPLEWKREHLQLDFKKLVSDYQAQAVAAKGDADFYRVLSRFLSELKDAHVSPMVPSTYRGTLGFTVDYVQGKVLIDSIDPLKLPPVLFPFHRGDQLLALGGVPVEQLMPQLAVVGNTGFDQSYRRITAARLTSRRESTGLEVPKGVTTVTVLPRGATQPVTVTATWINTGTPVLELDDLSSLTAFTDFGAAAAPANGKELLKQIAKDPAFSMRLPQERLDEFSRAGISDIGSPQSMFSLPANAKVLDDVSVTAASWEAAGKKIGLLRINGYDDDGLTDVLVRALQELQDTDVLVLDQTNNPGGSVSLVSDIVGLFATGSYKDMGFALRPSLPWLQQFQDMNSKIDDMLSKDANDMAANALKARFGYLESEIRDALTQKRFLTTPVSLNMTGTFGMIQPNDAVVYKKPVLLLINEFDFSGGDAFPAVMQDNGRVTTFGVRTTGAGGNVREYGPLANSFFKFHLTESLMVRPNGQYVENLGVKADVPYEITEDDFNNGYRGYVKAFTVEALKLAGASADDIQKFAEGGSN